MICLRRIAFRALSVPPTSIPVRPRLITTLPPISRLARQQKTFLPLQKRWASQEAVEESQEVVEESQNREDSTIDSSAVEPSTSQLETPTSADAEGRSYAHSPIDSAADAVLNETSGKYASSNTHAGAAQYDATDKSIPSRVERSVAFPPSNTVYVGNLFFDLQPTVVKDFFSEVGEVESVTIRRDAKGFSRGFGYVGFKDIETATKAIRMLDSEYLEGRRITVHYARPPSDRPPRDPKEGPEPTKNPPSPTLFIGNMPFDMSDKDLNSLFSKVKNVTDVRVAIDRRTGQPRGFAHADFLDVESAQKAMQYFAALEVNGRILRLDFSTGARHKIGQRKVEETTDAQ